MGQGHDPASWILPGNLHREPSPGNALGSAPVPPVSNASPRSPAEAAGLQGWASIPHGSAHSECSHPSLSPGSPQAGRPVGGPRHKPGLATHRDGHRIRELECVKSLPDACIFPEDSPFADSASLSLRPGDREASEDTRALAFQACLCSPSL